MAGEGSLFGMTCDGYDIIANSLKMPDMEIGDWLLMGGMGAYTFGPKSNFNGMDSLQKIFIQNWREENEKVKEVKEKA